MGLWVYGFRGLGVCGICGFRALGFIMVVLRVWGLLWVSGFMGLWVCGFRGFGFMGLGLEGGLGVGVQGAEFGVRGGLGCIGLRLRVQMPNGGPEFMQGQPFKKCHLWPEDPPKPTVFEPQSNKYLYKKESYELKTEC